MNSYRTGILVLLAAMAGLFFLWSQHQSSPPNTAIKNSTNTIVPAEIKLPESQTSATNYPGQSTTPLQQRYQAVSDNSQYPDIQSRQNALRQQNSAPQITDEELIDLLSERNAWRTAAEVPANLPLTAEEKNDGREFIELNPQRLRVLLPGDELQLPISGAADYTLVIDRIEYQANNSTTWHGHLKNTDEPMYASLTQGEGISLGGFDTPHGHYVIQANDGKGWVASSSTLFKPNPDHPTDIVIPPTDISTHE